MSQVRVRYQTIEFGNLDIHLRTLRNRQEFSDTDQQAERLGVAPASWPHFGVVWDSGEVLAQLMLTHGVTNLRVLEVGCGIGLASIVLSTRCADITATDHNPEAGRFLAANAMLNNLAPIAFERTSWNEHNHSLGLFDLIIGSDLLYEHEQVAALAQFIERHAEPRCQVLIVDPGRGLAGRFVRLMGKQGFDHDSSEPVQHPRDAKYHGRVINFSRSVA